MSIASPSGSKICFSGAMPLKLYLCSILMWNSKKEDRTSDRMEDRSRARESTCPDRTSGLSAIVVDVHTDCMTSEQQKSRNSNMGKGKGVVWVPQSSS